MTNRTNSNLSRRAQSWRLAGLVPLALGALTLLLSPQARATNYYWDRNGADAGSGGPTPSGIWSAGTTNWTTDGSGYLDTSANSVTTTAGDIVYFSAGSDASGDYTVTLSGLQSARWVVAEEGNVTLSGGTLAITNSLSSGGDYLNTVGTANLTLDATCTLITSNIVANNNFFNFKPAAGTTITINGPVKAAVNNAANKVTMRQSSGTGSVIFNTDLGSDPAFKTGFAAGGCDGAAGSITFNGPQNLGGTTFNCTSRKGTVNFGGTVNTGNAVTVGALNLNSGSSDLTGAAYNLNSAVSCSGIALYANAVMNVAGSMTVSGTTAMGSTTATYKSGTLNILPGATATMGTVNVFGESTLNDAGSLSGGTLTLGSGTTSGTLVLGDATTAVTARFTGLATSGTGPANAVVGGNSANSTLFVNNSSANTFAGVLGGAGVNQNNLAVVKTNTGTLTLSGANTYSGPTTILKGTLALGAAGSLNNTPQLSLGAGATLDVSAIASYTLSTSTTLSASGSGTNSGYMAAIKGGTSIDLGSQALNLGFSPTSFSGDSSHQALYIPQGSLTLNGRLTVTNNGASPLGVGTYVLIEQASGTISGTPTLNPVIAGQGLAAGTTSSLQVSGNRVELTVFPAAGQPTTVTLTRHAGTVDSTVYGDALQFDVTVSPASATGTVLLRDGGSTGTLLGSATLASGSCTIAPAANALPAGIHADLVAVYSGDIQYSPSTSAALAPQQTVATRTLTLPDAVANNKFYDGSAAATISGTLTGVVSGDTITLVGTGSFPSAAAGTNLAVTAACTLAGTKAANYTLTQPLGLTANIVNGGAVWARQASGTAIWEGATNWLDSSIIPNGSGVSADFSQLDITNDMTVQLTVPETIGRLVFGDTNTASAAGWTLNNNSKPANTLTLAGSSPAITVNALATNKMVTIANVLAGTSGLTKDGNGILSVTANNTLSGPVTVTAGTLRFNNVANQLGSSAVTLGGPGAVTLDYAGSTANPVTNDLVLTGSGAGSVTLSSTPTSGVMWSNLITGTPGSGGVIFTGGGNIEVRNEASTYTGGTLLASGNVIISGGVDNAYTQTPNSPLNGRFGTGVVRLNGATLRTGNLADRTIFNTVDFAADTTIPTGGGQLRLAGDLILNGAGGTRTLTQNSSSSQSIEGVIKNGTSTNLTKAGTGQLVLSGANTYSGNLTVAAGIVTCGSAYTLPSGSGVVIDGGNLNLAFLSQTVRSVQLFSGSISNGTSYNPLTSATDYDLRSGMVNAVLAGTVGAIKTTAGTVKLGYNQFTGPTIVNAGTLALDVYGSLDASSGLSLAAGTTFDVSSYDPAMYTLGGSCSLTASGTGLAVGVDAATIKGATNGTVDLGYQPVNLNFTPASYTGDLTHPALYISQGTLNLNGQVNLTNKSVTPLAAGTYVLIAQAGGTISGAPTLNPVIGGSGVAPNTTAALQVVDSNVVLVVTSVLPAPTVTITRHAGTGSSSTYGDSLQFDVTVTPATATGSVLVKDGGASGVLVGSGTLTSGACTITAIPNALTAGTHDNIVAVYAGDSSFGPGTSAPLSTQTVATKALTVAGATANNKIYDGTTAGTISGTLAGVVSGDSITLVGTGTFASANVGTGIAVTSTSTLGGAKAANYTLTQPVGLTANIVSGGIWTSLASGAWETAGNWLDGLIPATGSASADFSTLNLTADTTVAITSPKSVGSMVFGDTDTNSAAGWTISNNGAYTNTLTLAGANPTITVNALSADKAVTISNGIGGTNGLIKAGSGSLVLGGTNTFSGGLIVNAGNLILGDGNGSFTGGITNNGGVLTFSRIAQLGNVNIGYNALNLNGGAARFVSTGNDTSDTLAVNLLAGGGVIEVTNAGSTFRIGGVVSGAGTLVKTGPGNLCFGKNQTTTLGSTFTGKVLAREGTLEVRNPDALGSTSGVTEVTNATLAIAPYGQTINVTFNAEPLVFSGAPMLVNKPQFDGQVNTWTGPITNNGTANIHSEGTAGVFQIDGSIYNSSGSSLTIGTNNVSVTTVNGVISGPGSVAVQGTEGAVCTLTAANPYSGSTTVGGGRLVLSGSGSIANSPVINVSGGATLDVSGLASFSLGASQTLTGDGMVAGNVTANGTLSPGASVGTLSFNNNLTVAGNLVFDLDKTLAQSNDLISVSGTLNNTGTGTLTVRNLGPALAVGDKFVLFSKAVANGRSLAIAAPAGVTFTNNLPEDGSITVLTAAPSVPADPTSITAGVSGKTLNLSWPADHLGWVLQTNAVNVADPNSWFAYPGSASLTNVAIGIDGTKKNVFFRLVYPRQ